MREFRPYGSVRGARSNARPYRDSPAMTESAAQNPGQRLSWRIWGAALDGFGALVLTRCAWPGEAVRRKLD